MFSDNEVVVKDHVTGLSRYTIPVGKGYEVSIVQTSEHLFEAVLSDANQNTVLRCSYEPAYNVYHFVITSKTLVSEQSEMVTPVKKSQEATEVAAISENPWKEPLTGPGVSVRY